MSMGKAVKIYSKDHPALALKVTKGHFSSDRFHINYYIDMTDLKMRQRNAEEVAKAIVEKYVKRCNLNPCYRSGIRSNESDGCYQCDQSSY